MDKGVTRLDEQPQWALTEHQGVRGEPSSWAGSLGEAAGED